MTNLILILGDRGSGKTLLLTWFLLKSKTPFFSNYKLWSDKTRTKPHRLYNELFPEELLHLDTSPKKVAITEAYEYFECRLGMGAFPRYMSYVTFQSRKRGIDFLIDTQLEDTIDHRFTKLCNYVIIAEAEDYGFHYYITNKKIIREFDIPFKQAEKFWNLYDSWEIIMTPQVEELGKQIEIQNKPKLKIKIGELEKRFYEEYGENFEKKRITHALIESFLLDCEPSESDAYEPFLYARLQKPKLNK